MKTQQVKSTPIAANDNDLIRDLRQVSKADLPVAGGKGANLGELICASFSVPPGFVVTTLAYDRVVADSHLHKVIAQGLQEKEPDGASIRSAFEKVAIPPEVEQSILAAYQRLGQRPVAVRSSATAEDLPEAAFAGQQDTYLNIVGEHALLDAVRRCWASLWTERAIAYRTRQNVDQHTVKLAVVVQAMIAAEAAGVMFTANPVIGTRNEISIDASAGLGEAVVSGQVTPDHYVLRKQRSGWQVIERRIGRQEVIIRAQSSGGVEHVKGTDTINRAVLPDEVLHDLARLGVAIEGHFGCPQDIEWAWAESKLFILQARPITALPEPLLPVRGPQRLLGNLIGELVPTRPYPIDVTIWMPSLLNVISSLMTLMGLKVGAIESVFADQDGISIKPPHELPVRPTPAVLLAPTRIVLLALRYDPLKWRNDPLLVEVQSRARTLEARDLSTLSWTELLDTMRQALIIPTTLGEVRRRYLPRGAVSAGLLRLVIGILGYAKSFARLLSGSENETIATNRALEQLAAQIRADSALTDIFTNHDTTDLWQALESRPAGQAFKASIQAFMDRYGHREGAILLVSMPTWKDAPEIVLGMLKGFVQTPPQPETDQPLWEKERDKVLTHPLLRLSPLRSAFIALLTQARTLMPIREDTHFYTTLAMPTVRRVALEMGRRLVEVGIMTTPDEIFHFTRRDVEQIVRSWPLSPQYADQLRSIVAQRKQRRAALESTPYRNILIAPQMPDQGDVFLSGMAGSPGVIEGTVRVIHDQSEFGKLQAGDVLVAPYTNPAWTPLFQRAIAVIVDTGGTASHAAIVAREYGIPAVMGTVDATQRLVDGQRVRVDGSKGLVFLIT